MKAVVYPDYGVTPVLTEVPAPAAPGRRRGARGAGDGRVPLGLARVAGPRPRSAAPHPRARAGRVVAEVGAGVTRWRPGDRVTVPFVCGCGACEYCLAGDAQVCPHQTQPGFTGPGSFAERVAVPRRGHEPGGAARLRRLRHRGVARLPVRHGVPRADRARPARGGDWLAVHGCGGVGLSAVLIGVALGARVVAVDIARRRAGARDASSVRHTWSNATAEPDPAATVRELTGGGATVSIDALGSPDTAAASVRCLRRRGRHVQAGLLLGGATPLPMDVVVAHELEIYGSHGMAAADYPPMLALVADGTASAGVVGGQGDRPCRRPGGAGRHGPPADGRRHDRHRTQRRSHGSHVVSRRGTGKVGRGNDSVFAFFFFPMVVIVSVRACSTPSGLCLFLAEPT